MRATRRALCASLAGITATAVTAWSRLHGGTLHPDGDLLACVERFAAADQRQNAAILRFGEDLDQLDLPAHEDQRQWEGFLASIVPSEAALDAMLHEIAATPAYTADGRAAKARVVQRWIGDGWDTMRVPRQCPWERVAWSLAQDALRAPGAA